MARPPGKRELQLLLDYTAGKKTGEQVQADARTFRRGSPDLLNLMDSNASRGVSCRLQELTGISNQSLHRSEVRFLDDKRMHPFILPSTHVAKLVEADISHFEVATHDNPPDVVASSFMASPEYKEHPLVKELQGVETVVPMGFYADGVAVGSDIALASYSDIISQFDKFMFQSGDGNLFILAKILHSFQRT